MSSWADASDSPVSSPRNSGGAGGFGSSSSVGGPPRERPRLQVSAMYHRIESEFLHVRFVLIPL